MSGFSTIDDRELAALRKLYHTLKLFDDKPDVHDWDDVSRAKKDLEEVHKALGTQARAAWV